MVKKEGKTQLYLIFTRGCLLISRKQEVARTVTHSPYIIFVFDLRLNCH